MGVKLVSSSGGSVEVNPPATASNFTQTLVPITSTLAPLVSGTAVASTSGTSIDFTGIPSWVKRITVMFSGVSLSGTAYIRLQAGVSGTPTTTGYASYSSLISGAAAINSVASTSGLDMFGASAAYSVSGALRFQNVTGNVWVIEGVTSSPVSGTFTQMSAGLISLSGVLNMIRITTSNGTDTFDAGSINILYE